MASVRQTDTAAPAPAPADTGGADDAELELNLEKAEHHLREERDHRVFAEHPNGIGPTLGQDLGRPNPGHDADWDDEAYDPPT